MIVFLDTNIVIYLIERQPGFGPRARAQINLLRSGGHTLAVSDLVCMECRVLPIRLGNLPLLSQYDAFFTANYVRIFPLTTAVCERATLLRAGHRFKTADALQLAAAIVHGCDQFLTNDVRLSACTDIPITVLP